MKDPNYKTEVVRNARIIAQFANNQNASNARLFLNLFPNFSLKTSKMSARYVKILTVYTQILMELIALQNVETKL